MRLRIVARFQVLETTGLQSFKVSGLAQQIPTDQLVMKGVVSGISFRLFRSFECASVGDRFFYKLVFFPL